MGPKTLCKEDRAAICYYTYDTDPKTQFLQKNSHRFPIQTAKKVLMIHHLSAHRYARGSAVLIRNR